MVNGTSVSAGATSVSPTDSKIFCVQKPPFQVPYFLKNSTPKFSPPSPPNNGINKKVGKKNYGERGGKFSNDNLFNRSWRMHIHNSQQNQNFFDHFQTYTAIYYSHYELSREEEIKFEFEEKKFSLLLKVAFSRQKRLQTSLFSNKLNFFSSNSNFDFSSSDNSG